MEKGMSENDKRDRTLRALEVASASGFMVSVRSIQAACLGLCNASRESAPVHRLTISRRGPPAFLAMLCPDTFHPEVETASRVIPPRRVLKVEIRGCGWSPGADDKYVQAGEEDEPGFKEPADVRLVDVRWPTGTKELHIPFVKDGVDRVAWPVGLEVLSFFLRRQGRRRLYTRPAEGLFNSPLDSSRFPSGLREIFMGSAFNQSIEGVAWPKGLERLSLPGFNQSIQGVQWPAGLKSLEFVSPSEILLRGDYSTGFDALNFESGVFNQPLRSTLPASLETLWLSDRFHQGLKNVIWPSGLISLGFGVDFHCAFFRDISWPPCLRKLFTVTGLGNQEAPAGCVVVSVVHEADDEEDY